MSSKIEVPRELLERISQWGSVTWPDKNELRALLAESATCAKSQVESSAPVVERQVMGRVYHFDDGARCHLTSEGRSLADDTPLYASPPAPVSLVLPTRETMRDLIAEVIGGDAYDCIRVWDAWAVGTMSADDFVPLVDQDERLYEIADACLAKVKELSQSAQTACKTCQGYGVIGWTSGQTAESFDQGEAPCPDCQHDPIEQMLQDNPMAENTALQTLLARPSRWETSAAPSKGGRSVPYSSLCYGAKFMYTEGEAAVWVKVGHNVIAGWKAEHVATNWVAQPLCSFSEDDDDVSALVWLIDEGSPV